MAGFLIALLSGALMSVQGVFNAQVTKTTGIWVSNGWVQLSAFFVPACLAGNWKRLCCSTYGSPAALYVAGRCDRSRDHMDCH